jgi:subtilisin family serine protease
MNSSNLRKTLGVVALVAIVTGAYAARSTLTPPLASKVAPAVLKALENNSDNIPILVKLKKQASVTKLEDVSKPREERIASVYDALREVALESQKEIVDLVSTRGMKYRRFYIYNAIAVYGANAELIKELAARDDVEKVYANPTVALSRPSDFSGVLNQILSGKKGFTAAGDNISFLKADQIWAKYGKAGDGIVVAGQDSGVEWDHPALVNQYRGTSGGSFDKHAFNWHDAVHKEVPMSSGNDCGYDLDAPCDDGDHGSHTMGTMVGSDGGENVIGMAPKAQWIACRNMDGGNGTPASYLECFEWLLAPYAYGADPMKDGKPSMAPHVINNSWGCPTDEGCSADEIVPALAAMKAAGIMVVVSAGNDGPDCSTIQDPPAWHSALTFGVGAYDHRSGVIAGFSSRGPSKFDNEIGPDLVAPGVNIRSSIRGKKYAGAFWSGTSMAGPHVAGAVALLWSIHPELIGNIDATAELFRKTAEAKTTTQTCGGVPGTALPNNTYGYGVIDPLKAIEAADTGSIPTPPTTPTNPGEESGSSWPGSIRRR